MSRKARPRVSGPHQIASSATTGRFSRVRSLAGLQPIRTAPGFDLLWFRVPRAAHDPGGGVHVGQGGWLVMLNRGSCWQVAYSLPKGGYPALRSAGLDELRRSLGLLVPWLASRAETVTDWAQLGLLTVELSRLRHWYRPGLLPIGDAAHTMSPVGGVGISVAVQAAAVAPNVLGPARRTGRIGVADLAHVQRQREFAVPIVQRYQALVGRWLTSTRRDHAAEIPPALRLQASVRPLADVTARVFGLGVWPVRLNPA